MRVLLDSCVWGGAERELTAAGHDVRWVGSSLPDPGDAAIIRLAFSQDRVLITLDKDFGELAIVDGHPHRGIVRLVDIPGRQQGTYCVRLLATYGDELLLGAILTAIASRVRIRNATAIKSETIRLGPPAGQASPVPPPPAPAAAAPTSPRRRRRRPGAACGCPAPRRDRRP
jgi:predicted nuclease of predicted toxin-antitoxin system